MLHAQHDVVVAPEEIAVARRGRHAGGIHLAEEVERVVADPVPEEPVHGAEEAAGFAVPAPPQVHRDGGQALDAGREIRDARLLRQHDPIKRDMGGSGKRRARRESDKIVTWRHRGAAVRQWTSFL